MKAILRQVLLFSFFALLIVGSYSSFTSLLNYIHKAHDQSHVWHAQIFFVINTVSAIFFNGIIPNLKITDIKKLLYGLPVSFFMIYLCTYIGFMSTDSTFTLIFTVFSGIFAGIGNAISAIVSGKYLCMICEINGAKQDQGKYFGIYGSIMSCNFFLGAALSASSLSYFSKKHDLYLVLGILAIIGFFYCKFLIKNPKRPNTVTLEESSTSRQTNKTQLDNITLIEETKKENEKWIQLKIKFNKQCFQENMFVYKKMASLIPFQVLNGLTVGYIMHCLEDLVFAPDPSSKDTFLTISLMVVGIGGAIGAYSAGYFSDHFSSKTTFRMGVTVCLVSFILGMVTLNYQNQALSIFTSLLSGFGMMYTNSMLVIMCSKYYDGSMMVFGTNRQIINLALLIYSLLINVISPQNMHSQMYYELLVLIVIGLGCLYMVTFIREKKYQKKETAIGNESSVKKHIDVDMNKEKEIQLTDGI